MDHRVVFAGLLAGASLSAAPPAPASAQSVQQAQRQVFACVQKANGLQLREDKKQEYIDACVAKSEQPAAGRKDPD